ncbi:phage tail tape measure protein, partial [Brucella abortus]|uniref:phage tail tape measure protein n=1 Tax=Brucella abortus TaxID=235 RepID=UPI000F8ECCE2
MTDFRIRVIVDPSGAAQGTRAVEGHLNRVGSAATRVQSLIARAFAFTGITVGLTGAIRLLANFEQQMSTVRAITGATEAQFRALRTEAQRLGAMTRFSASEAADGMQFLARAGFDVNQVLASIEDTLLLAQAGALDLGTAADIASNILTGFRLQAEEAGRVVDVLALAANSANTNVQQLGDAMKFVAPVASGLGVSLEEAAAAVSALSDAGLQGSMAGTGLRRVLSELESPTAKTQRILRQMGLTANDVRISQVGLTNALLALRDAGVDTGLALEIFGDRGGPAFEVLSNSIPRVQELTEELNNAGGTAERIARIMDDNLNGALLAVRSAAEGLILAFGDAGATGVFTTFFALVAEGLRFLTANIDTLIRAVEVFAVVMATRFVVATLSAQGAIGGLIRQVIALEFALGATTTRAALFSAGMKAAQRAVIGLTAAMAANPIGAIAVAISAVIALLYIFGDQIKVTEDGVVSLQDVFVAAFQLIMEAVGPVLSFLDEGFRQAFAAIGVSVEGFVD